MKIKKLLHIVFLVFLCPIALGSVSQKGYFPVPKSEAINANQPLNLSSSDLGLKGPISLSAQYSSEFGYLLQGQWTKKLSLNNALSLMLDLGQNERRVNATWGHILTPKQRFKLTAEYLEQNKSFDFLSGNEKTWVGQSAYGLTYQYSFPHSFVNDINFNAFYSHAFSKNLSQKLFTDSDGEWINLRRIAGGTEKSASLGVDLLPAKSSLLGLQLNYDNIHYNTRYEKADNDSGLGATVSLNQLITKRIKFNLLASSRKTDDTYQAGLSWLLHSKPGTQLELALSGTRILGRTAGMTNDSRIGLSANYSWGGPADSISSYQINAPADTSDLTAWTAEPAVHMNQVLAVKDEAKIKLKKPEPHIMKTSNPEITVKPGEAKTIDIAEYMTASNSTDSLNNYAVDYPLNHDLSYKNNLLTIHKDSFTSSDLGKTYTITIQSPQNTLAASMQPNNAPKELLIKISNSGNNLILRPDPNFTKNWNFQYSSKIDIPVYWAYSGSGEKGDTPTNGLFVDDHSILRQLNITKSDVQIKQNGKDVTNDFSIDLNQTPHQKSFDTGTLEIKSTSTTPLDPSIYTVTVNASNDQGPADNPQVFTITVGTIVSPAITPSGTHWNVGTKVDNKPFATITAGSGTLQSVTYDKNAFQKDYGLTLSDKFNADKTQDVVSISGTPTKATVTGSEPEVKITAQNTAPKSVSADLKLYVDQAPTKPIVEINPEPKQSWQAGHAIEKFKIATITAESGTLKTADFPKTIDKLTLSDDGIISGKTTVDNVYISGTPEMAMQSPILITATNTSVADQGKGTFNLHIAADSSAPIVTPVKQPDVKVNEKYPSPGDIIEIQAGREGDTITKVDFDNPNAFTDYGLKMNTEREQFTGKTIAYVTLTGTAKLPETKPANWPTVTVTVTNSENKKASATFTLSNIKPILPTITQEGSLEFKEGDSFNAQPIVDIKANNGDLNNVQFDKDSLIGFNISLTQKTISKSEVEIDASSSNVKYPSHGEPTSPLQISAANTWLPTQPAIKTFTVKVDKDQSKPTITLENDSYPYQTWIWRMIFPFPSPSKHLEVATVHAALGHNLANVSIDTAGANQLANHDITSNIKYNDDKTTATVTLYVGGQNITSETGNTQQQFTITAADETNNMTASKTYSYYVKYAP